MGGKQFQLYTDHSALVFLLTTKADTSAKFYRWVLALSQFDFMVAHKPGVQMGGPDALSRLLAVWDDIDAYFDDFDNDETVHRVIETLASVHSSSVPQSARESKIATSDSSPRSMAWLSPVLTTTKEVPFDLYQSWSDELPIGASVCIPATFLQESLVTDELLCGGTIVKRPKRSARGTKNDWTIQVDGAPAVSYVRKEWLLPAAWKANNALSTRTLDGALLSGTVGRPR